MEVEGKAKINVMDKHNEGDSIVVRLPDGTLAIRDAPSILSMGSYHYFDMDGDSSGDMRYPVWVPTGVTPPVGFVSTMSDCNDNDSLIHPNATEICTDGIDQDCDGLVDCLDDDCSSMPVCNMVDILFLLDITGDMESELNALKANFANILNELSSIAPGMAIGLSVFQDFPETGSATDVPYALLSPISTNFTAAQVALQNISASGGGTSGESGNEALYQAATGEGISWPGGSIPASNAQFRNNSFLVVLVITSEPFSVPMDYLFPTHSQADAIAALLQIDAKVISIATGTNFSAARPDLEAYALATDAFTEVNGNGQCDTGLNGTENPPTNGVCPIVFDAIDAGISTQIINAVETLLTGSYDN